MPGHRPGQLAVIGRRAGRHPAVPLRHALIEHAIGRHPDLCGGVLAADLLQQGRVVVGLTRPLRKRGGTCAQEDDRGKPATSQGRRPRAASNLIDAPAIRAAVESASPIDRHPDALGKSIRTFLKALDTAPILVGKFDRPPGLLPGLLFGRGACQQQKRHDIGQAPEHGFFPHKERPSKMSAHCAAACCARLSISSSVRVLSGCWITAGVRSCMPSASRCTSASCRNSVVTITAVGRPAASRLMPSCVQHDVHDPQSPIAVTTMSLSAAMAAINAGSASLEKLSLR
jgi:hypothetical protein